MADVHVTHNEAQNRYEARVGDELAGFAEYQLTDELVVFTHTEVEPAFEGKGVGGALAGSPLTTCAPRGAVRSCRSARSSRRGSASTPTTSRSSTGPPARPRPTDPRPR